jgi:hypothetical protein
MEDNKQNTNNTTVNTDNTNNVSTAPQTQAGATSTQDPAVNNLQDIANEVSKKDVSTAPQQTPTANSVGVSNTPSATSTSTVDQAIASIQSIPTNSSTTANDDIITQIAENIIKEQESIIGPVALEQAIKVEGLKIDLATNKITFEGDKKEILERLVKQYELLFGRISVEICKEAVRNIIPQAPKDQVPQILL